MNLVSYIRNQWDRVSAWGCVAAGALALMLGYLGVSGTLDTGRQLPYVVSGGLVGLFFLGLGAMLWLSADLRDEWRKLDAIDRHVLTTGALQAAGGSEAQLDLDALTATDQVRPTAMIGSTR